MPRWTAQQLADWARSKANRKTSCAEPQRDQTPALGGPTPGKAGDVPRITVRIRGCRVRPLDPDNFTGGCKDLLDGLRHAQLLPDDTIWDITLETTQKKVQHFSEERTEVVLCYPQKQ